MSRIKPYLTFPFLWGAGFVIFIYFFTDSVMQQMFSPFLMPSEIVVFGCLSYIIFYLCTHSKSFFDFFKKLTLMISLFFWIPISIMNLATVIEVFFLPTFRQEHDAEYLPSAVVVTALNIVLFLLFLIRKHKRKINKK